MRTYRIALVAGWVVVASLAVVGFATFTAQDEDGASEPPAFVISADLGRNAGAVSALVFARLADGGPAPVTTIDLDEAVDDLLRSRQASAVERTTTSVVIRTAPTVINRARRMSESDVRTLIERYFAPEDVSRAVRVAWCESSFNPRSVNPSTGASGLFQHLPGLWEERSAAAGWTGADIFDPEANVAVAAWLLYDFPGGWSHWSCQA